MPCYTELPEESWGKHLEKMLCYACRFLTRGEMLRFSDDSGWQGIFQWYKEHLVHDYINNESVEEKIRCIKEADRLGLKIIEGKDFTEIIEKEKN